MNTQNAQAIINKAKKIAYRRKTSRSRERFKYTYRFRLSQC